MNPRLHDIDQILKRLLAEAGISTEGLSNIDLVDAALCARTADYLVRNRFRMYGDVAGGYIVVSALTSVGASRPTWCGRVS